jgi:uncharacterized membrane protein YeaQ/YmgE (transglycosylase-associated protein family)
MEENKDYLQKAKDIIDKDKREILLMTTKASVNGAVTGLVLGLMLGYYKHKNIYVTGLVGAILGGVATTIIVRKK